MSSTIKQITKINLNCKFSLGHIEFIKFFYVKLYKFSELNEINQIANMSQNDILKHIF